MSARELIKLSVNLLECQLEYNNIKNKSKN